VINSDVSRRTPLTDIPAEDHRPPTWSPDGTEGKGEIYVINADGSELTSTQLTDRNMTDYDESLMNLGNLYSPEPSDCLRSTESPRSSVQLSPPQLESRAPVSRSAQRSAVIYQHRLIHSEFITSYFNGMVVD
jgi:hypothetical protein